jgi:hypothetical protein
MLRGGKRMKRIAVMMICMLVIPIVASADLTIREKTHIRAFMGVWVSEGSELTYIKGEKMRSESETEKTGMGAQRGVKAPPPAVTIVRLDKGVVWHINTLDKTYMESPLDPVPEAGDQEVYRFSFRDLVVEDTGETREVMGKVCDGVKAAIVFETEGDDGPVVQTVDVLFWMTSEVKVLAQLRSFWETMIEMTQGTRERIPLGDAMAELWEKVGKDGKVPLAMDMSIAASSLDPESEAKTKASLEAMSEMMKERSGEEEGLIGDVDDTAMRMTREIISISEDKLPDSLFEIPEGFRKAQQIRRW